MLLLSQPLSGLVKLMPTQRAEHGGPPGSWEPYFHAYLGPRLLSRS